MWYRILPCALLVVSLLAAAPAKAQFSFEGLDLSEEKKEEKPKKKKGKKKKKKEDDEEEDSGGGMDFSGVDLSGDGDGGGETEDPGGDTFGGDIQINIGEQKVEDHESTMKFEGIDTTEAAPAGEEQKQAFEAAKSLMDDKNYEAASVAFQKLLEDPAAGEFHPEAQYLLAKAVYRLGMYHSALLKFNDILTVGEAHRFFNVALEWLFFISRKTVSESVVLEDIAAHADAEFPDKYKDEYLYLLAKYYFARGRALDEAEQPEEAQTSYDEAGRLLGGIAAGSQFYPKSRFLQGLVHYQAGRPGEALEEFKDVVRLTNPRKDRFRNSDLRDLAFMQLARLHFEHKQNAYAAWYYNKLPRDSDQWLEALFESSWAYFRLGDYERSLGNMVTLHSPFFSSEYFPESLILKAVIYYENCRYPEARAILDEFEKVYGPVQSQLAELSNSGKTADAYYDMLADAQKSLEAGTKTDDTIMRILKAALTDKEFVSMNASIREVEEEMDSIADKKQVFKFSALAKELLTHLKEKRRDLIQKAGLMASAKLYSENEALKALIGQALRIKFEISSKEEKNLDESLKAGALRDDVTEYSYSVAVSDEELYWPYEGEYWRDELGNFQYSLSKGCKEGGGNLTASAGTE